MILILIIKLHFAQVPTNGKRYTERMKPGDDSNISHEAGGINVRLIAGVPDQYHKDKFGKKLEANGISSDLLEPLGSEGPDTCVSFMESQEGRARQVVNFRTSNKWTTDHFDRPSKIYGSDKPDLRFGLEVCHLCAREWRLSS